MNEYSLALDGMCAPANENNRLPEIRMLWADEDEEWPVADLFKPSTGLLVLPGGRDDAWQPPEAV